MQTRWRAALAACAFLMLSAVSGLAKESVKWQTSFSAAKAMAKSSHKLIFVDFYADW